LFLLKVKGVVFVLPFLTSFQAEDHSAASHSASGSPSHVSAPATSRYGLFEASFKIKNIQFEKAVLFRIRTTSPANYRVKPAYGRIEPSEEQNVRGKG
jgi:hypothetical protein